ncbi:hypothetical protein [Sulfurovum sp. NBC37-1]|uniref:hypothetical protein n=1 Tax=Sulfurovum sp. (strain NBC37-1) TaxID=387093 RepID=UPI0001587975|nr:hypothetical protein [Sulfurovum sp. NBC37-1]BAF72952.1 hypothetical protein SUN_2010 [Sulfurovum sp. NBC37-1]
MKKILMTTAIATLTTVTMAAEKIDIYKYDMITIYKNVPSTIAKMEMSSIKMTNDGVNPYKVLKGKVLSCKKLGFDGKEEKQDFPDHLLYHYTKHLKNDVEASCDENVYKGGTVNFSVLVDGND